MEAMDVGSWLIVAFAFLVLPLATRPAVQRVAVALAERTDEWSKARAAVKDRMDPEQEKLWLWTKRRRLCAAIDRIEQLIATDDWMSATRQLGNRLAYEQLLDELRHTPDVFPAGLDSPAVDYWAQPLSERARTRRIRTVRDDGWDESTFTTGWSAATPAGFSAQPGEVEFLDIGRRREP
ncbi:hypothetical protein [Microlunatus ginsengisoli]|uniref:Sec-independent protein translocase protein TatB n=1 Tax=Microlunatus ginsengisoli TaxID=363863 RepID=A0ABP7ARZ8_9ACTN